MSEKRETLKGIHRFEAPLHFQPLEFVIFLILLGERKRRNFLEGTLENAG